MSEPDWIGVRLQGPVDVMRRLAERLDRAPHPNDDHGTLPLNQIRTERVYFLGPTGRRAAGPARAAPPRRPPRPRRHARPRAPAARGQAAAR